MSDYTPSLVLLGGLYLEHRKEKLGKQFDADEAWQEFMQFVKNKQANAWDEGQSAGISFQAGGAYINNPYRKDGNDEN